MNTMRTMIVSMSLVIMGLVSAAKADDVASLIKQLGAWSNNKAKKASDELAAMGKSVVPEVSRALSSKSRRRGRFAARTLRQMGQDAAGAMPALLEALKDSDALTREYSVEALAKMVRQADRIIPVLRPLTEDEDEDVRRQAGHAIDRLTEALKSPPPMESTSEPPRETPSADAASQPSGSNVSNSQAVPASPSPHKASLLDKLSPIVVIRFALIAFIVVGFFSLLYVNRDLP